MSETRIEDPEFGTLARRSGDWEGAVALPLPGGESVALSAEMESIGGFSDAQREAARYAIGLTSEAQGRLAETLHADYLMTLDAVGPDDLPPIDAPAEVWAHVAPIKLSIPDHETLQHRYFVLQFEVAWETEGGAEVLFRDGEPVEVDIIGSTRSPGSYDGDDDNGE